VNLAKLVVGSEGPSRPSSRRSRARPGSSVSGLAVLHFRSLEDALETGCEILELHPSAIELVDEMVSGPRAEVPRVLALDVLRPGSAESTLVVEFMGATEAEVSSSSIS
jgi:hypothetical protein